MSVDSRFLKAAWRSARAGWWELRLARLFGTRVEGRDGIARVVCYRWRGHLYMVKADTSSSGGNGNG